MVSGCVTGGVGMGIRLQRMARGSVSEGRGEGQGGISGGEDKGQRPWRELKEW